MLSTFRVGIKQAKLNLKSGDYKQLISYSRWAHRRPVRVITQEEPEDIKEHSNRIQEEFSNDVTRMSKSPIKWRHSPEHKEEESRTLAKKIPRRKQNMSLKKDTTFDMLQTVIDSNGEVVYTKMANKDPRITMLMTTVKSKGMKVKQNVILLEGKRLIKEALENNCKLKNLLFSRRDDLEFLKSYLPKNGALIYKMPLREMQIWSDLVQCPGIMGIFDQPSTENFTLSRHSVPITIICDNIREPGNLGSILRTCAGVGCQQIILTKGCVNLWDTKVTRGSCGAHFKLQIHSKLDWPEIKTKVNAPSQVFMADNSVFYGAPNSAEETAFKLQSIPLLPYYSVTFNKTHPIILIIGGETEGLSQEACNFVHESGGARLNIPLENGVESLNSGVAIGVILFEIRKQINLKCNELLESKSVG